MNLMETIAHITESDTEGHQDTVQILKRDIFADDLRDSELLEAIVTRTYHNYSLIRDAMKRLGHKTLHPLIHEALELIRKYPGSYSGEDEGWAIWDAADNFVMEVLSSDSRICKRAGWEDLPEEATERAMPRVKYNYVTGWQD